MKTSSRFIVAVFFLLSIVYRVTCLGHIPGINGDEAWYGVTALQPFQWSIRTPTGNILNPFYILPLFLVQKFQAPHFWILRSVSVLSGVALVVLGYFLLRRSLGTHVAQMFLLLSAVAPDLVIYSRFGWDASQTGLASLLLLYFSLEKKWGKSIAAQIVLVIIHPANALLAFVPALLFLLDVWTRATRPARKIIVSSTLSAVVLLPVTFIIFPAGLESMARELMEHGMKQLGVMILGIQSAGIVHRLTSVNDWMSLFILYGDLITGATSYQYIAGPLHPFNAAIHIVFFWMGILPVILYGCWHQIRKREFQAPAIFLGILLALIVMYLFFGTMPISPHYERYSQFLVVPTLLLLVIGLNAFDLRTSHIGTALISIFWASSIILNYFVPFHTTGGASHRTFRTAAVEPKEQAAHLILTETKGTNTTIVAEDWWLAVPLRYLLQHCKNIKVIQYDDLEEKLDYRNIVNQGGFLVTFAESPWDQAINASIPSQQCKKKVIADAGGSPLLHVWYARP